MRYCENKSDYKIERFAKWLKHESADGVLHFDNAEFQNLHPEAWAYAMEMTEKETMQAVEAMYHNLNTLQSRTVISYLLLLLTMVLVHFQKVD